MRLREQTVRRVLRRGAVAGAIFALVALIALWLAFQRKPAWYRPAVLDAAGIQRARREVSNLTDRIGDQLVRREPFELTLRQGDVNAWLAALPHIWPDAARRMRPNISNPAVAFTGDGVHIGVELASKGWRVIASMAVSVSVTENGQSLCIVPSRPYGGSLLIPRSILDPPLERLLLEAREETSRDRMSSVLAEVETVDDLFQGITVPNRFVWPNGQRPFRIGAIQSADGALRLHIEPL